MLMTSHFLEGAGNKKKMWQRYIQRPKVFSAAPKLCRESCERAFNVSAIVGDEILHEDL